MLLEQARTIVAAAFAKGRELSLEPLVVAVLDAGGNLVAYEREDGAGIARFDIAFSKAWGSLGMGFGSRELTERAAKSPVFISVIATVTGGRMAPSPGGVLISDGSGQILGAVGVSGDVGDNDEACAIAGAQAAGLLAHSGKIARTR